MKNILKSNEEILRKKCQGTDCIRKTDEGETIGPSNGRKGPNIKKKDYKDWIHLFPPVEVSDKVPSTSFHPLQKSQNVFKLYLLLKDLSPGEICSSNSRSFLSYFQKHVS